MMYGHEKSDLAIVAVKPANKAERIRHGVGGAKGRDRGECSLAKHALDSAPGSRGTGAGRTQGWEPYAGKPHVRISVRGARGNSRPYREVAPDCPVVCKGFGRRQQ